MKYTPPDIAEALYNFLPPSEALMLRGLVAKFNGHSSNCARVVIDREPTVEEIFQQKLASQTDRAVGALEYSPVLPTQTALAPELSPDLNRDDIVANSPQIRTGDSIYVMIVKTLLHHGQKNITDIQQLVDIHKPGVTVKSIASALWRLKKQCAIQLIRTQTNRRKPLYDLAEAFWADPTNWV